MAEKSDYLLPGRVADVLALIQALAMDEHAHRSDSPVNSGGPPRLAKSWSELAKKHPEFFHVKPDGEHRVSLIALHVTPRDAADGANDG